MRNRMMIAGWTTALLLAPGPYMLAEPADDAPAVAADALPAANRVVLTVIERVPTGGGYVWKDTGVPFDLVHRGRTVLGKSKEGTYCSGVTFAVVMRAAQRLGLLNRHDFDAVKQFQRRWYGSTPESAERQCVFAMEQLGIGGAVAFDDARPGDFVQFWRGKSGHSVVFLNWVTNDAGRRIGLHYWSSQTATDGVGAHTEYFKDTPGHEGSVDPQRLYLGRLNDGRRGG